MGGISYRFNKNLIVTTQQAINAIYAPKGVTSIIEGILHDDFSVMPHEKGKDANILKAEEMIAKYEKDLHSCKSDWSYWSILGDLVYWKAIKNILDASAIAGSNNLPDIPIPDLNGCVVMDAIYKVEKFGFEVLSKTKELTVS
jgi:hypothetical protein